MVILKILSWGENTKLKIGKFCSIADNVTIFLGGEHRNDWVSTYPFNALLKNYEHIEGHPKSKGDVIIGNDVWIGSRVVILSGVKIGDGAIDRSLFFYFKRCRTLLYCRWKPWKTH